MNFLLHPLVLVTLLPLVGFTVIAFLKSEQKNAIRWTALLTSLGTFGVALAILFQFNPQGAGGIPQSGMQMILKQDWLAIGRLPIHFEMGLDGLSLLMELENYASSGLTPFEVLRTATTVSAEAMGAGADLGSIEPGKLADLVVIDGNPLANIKDLRRVKRVVKNGQVFEFDALLRRPVTTPSPASR